MNKRPAGLKAVVAQEPVYDLYRYLYGDGIRRLNSAATPALYNLIDAHAGPGARATRSTRVNGADDLSARAATCRTSSTRRATTTTARPTGCRAT